jgi:hypothetical protein
MLKRIALLGFFFLASATPGVSQPSSPPPASHKVKIDAPTSPVPQGWCFTLIC